MFSRNLVIIAFTVLLAGCVAAPQSLRQVASERIETVDQVLIIAQSNLDITVTQTNPGASGLIGALLVGAYDEYRRSAARQEAEPIIAALQDVDFRIIMLRAMNTAVTAERRLRYPINTTLESIDSDSTRRVHFSDSSASAVLFTVVSYRLESGNLKISATLEAYPKIAALMPFRQDPDAAQDPGQALTEGNTIYHQRFEFEKQGITGANIEASLTDGTRSIARQIVLDISHPVNKGAGGKFSQ